jgi:hypothetical protein
MFIKRRLREKRYFSLKQNVISVRNNTRRERR